MPLQIGHPPRRLDDGKRSRPLPFGLEWTCRRLAQGDGDVRRTILESHRKQQARYAQRIQCHTTSQRGLTVQHHPLLEARLNHSASVTLDIALPASALQSMPAALGPGSNGPDSWLRCTEMNPPLSRLCDLCPFLCAEALGPPTTAPKAGLLPQRRPASIGDAHRVGRPSGAPLVVPYVLKTGRARRQTAPPMRPFHIQFAGARPRFVPVDGKPIFAPAAGVVKLVDTPDLGSGAVRCVGSSPSART